MVGMETIEGMAHISVAMVLKSCLIVGEKGKKRKFMSQEEGIEQQHHG
jgi:hypothetical protein